MSSKYDGIYKKGDEQSEEEISAYLGYRWRCEMIKQGHYDKFDYLAKDGIQVRCVPSTVPSKGWFSDYSKPETPNQAQKRCYAFYIWFCPAPYPSRFVSTSTFKGVNTFSICFTSPSK